MANLVDIHILRTYHQCLEAMSRVVPFGREVLFDDYLNIYEHVLFKLGLFVKAADVELTPLLFLATLARDSVVRHRAIDLLRQCDQEGKSLAVIAEHVINVEEEGLVFCIAYDGVSEERRIRILSVQPLAQQKRVMLTFSRFPHFPLSHVGTD